MTVLSDNSRDIGLSPEEVGARVTAILTAAEREAREIIEAARRDVRGADHDSHRSLELPEPADGAGTPALAAVTRALESLSSRVGAFERRLEVLWHAIAPAPEGRTESAPSPTVVSRAERLRAVDLALRGFSRAQIAAELRLTLPDAQIEALLDDVLEGS